MNGKNYQKAVEEANKIDSIILETLQSGKSFRVEAGAGSGKTYSLNKVIDWIQDNRWNEYKKKKQEVICITYTNAAVDVIKSRLKENSPVAPSTIHSFAWRAIKQYQSFLVKKVKEDERFWAQDGDINTVNHVEYDLGHKFIKDGVLYLFHDDVINLFVALLDNIKFRRILGSKYPLILIDEYQDSFASIIDKFIQYYIETNVGPQFGFFGDSWQTIYQAQKACGLIKHKNIIEIKKNANFRSAPRIVELLNKLRPDLKQISAIDNYEGETVVVHCNDFTGTRRSDRSFKEDLPANELKTRLDNMSKVINNHYPQEKLKTLMLTHKVLAIQQGYENILSILGDRFKNNEDELLLFFENKIEPIYVALENNDIVQLSDLLGIDRVPIKTKAQKKAWASFLVLLKQCRSKKAIDVLSCSINSELIPIPKAVEKIYSSYHIDPNGAYENGMVKDYLELPYSEFLAAISFLSPETGFSTDHGVKGEEYDNVLFTITKGWYNYQFDVYAPLINSIVPADKEEAFERNRNLFYVCCSRPKNRLFLFVSFPVAGRFETFLKNLVGETNYYSYNQFMSKYNI